MPATRHDIWTSKSGPNMVYFVHFNLEMRFAPQRRAFFRNLTFPTCSDTEVFCTCWLLNVLRATTASTLRHLNFQTCSDTQVFCTFWLGNVLRATTACTFLSYIWLHGSASAALASLLFDPPEPQIIGKTQCFAAFLPFRAPISSFFWLFLWLFLPLLVHLSMVPEVWLLNFFRLFSY